MRITDWIERLRSNTDLAVQGAADLAAAQAEHRRDTAYVLLADEQAASFTSINAIRQEVTVGVGVVLAVRNQRDRLGAAATSELETARDQVRAALLGWTPPGAATPTEYRRGRLLSFVSATIWWQDEYQVTEHLAVTA